MYDKVMIYIIYMQLLTMFKLSSFLQSISLIRGILSGSYVTIKHIIVISYEETLTSLITQERKNNTIIKILTKYLFSIKCSVIK